MKAKIKSINEVQYNGDILVSLCGMRADLTDCIRIKPQRVANCFIPNNDKDKAYLDDRFCLIEKLRGISL